MAQLTVHTAGVDTGITAPAAPANPPVPVTAPQAQQAPPDPMAAFYKSFAAQVGMQPDPSNPDFVQAVKEIMEQGQIDPAAPDALAKFGGLARTYALKLGAYAQRPETGDLQGAFPHPDDLETVSNDEVKAFVGQRAQNRTQQRIAAAAARKQEAKAAQPSAAPQGDVRVLTPKEQAEQAAADKNIDAENKSFIDSWQGSQQLYGIDPASKLEGYSPEALQKIKEGFANPTDPKNRWLINHVRTNVLAKQTPEAFFGGLAKPATPTGPTLDAGKGFFYQQGVASNSGAGGGGVKWYDPNNRNVAIGSKRLEEYRRAAADPVAQARMAQEYFKKPVDLNQAKAWVDPKTGKMSTAAQGQLQEWQNRVREGLATGPAKETPEQEKARATALGMVNGLDGRFAGASKGTVGQFFQSPDIDVGANVQRQRDAADKGPVPQRSFEPGANAVPVQPSPLLEKRRQYATSRRPDTPAEKAFLAREAARARQVRGSFPEQSAPAGSQREAAIAQTAQGINPARYKGFDKDIWARPLKKTLESINPSLTMEPIQTPNISKMTNAPKIAPPLKPVPEYSAAQ